MRAPSNFWHHRHAKPPELGRGRARDDAARGLTGGGNMTRRAVVTTERRRASQDHEASKNDASTPRDPFPPNDPRHPMKTAPQPFDPDAMFARGHAADFACDEAANLPKGMMLSDLLAAMEPDAEEKAKQWEAVQPTVEAGPGTSTPLDNRRKGNLSQLARQTWLQLKARGVIDELETLEAFRGRISIAACGRRIRCATVADFGLIQAGFLREAGRQREAARATAKAMSTARDIALAKVMETVRTRRFNLGYAEGIAARIYKRPLASLKAKELWTVNYTMINNANARDGKGNAANRFKKLKASRNTNKSA